MSPSSSPGSAEFIECVLPNQIDALATFMARFAEKAAERRVPDSARRAMSLALDELLTNVITHAWTDQAAHSVRVRVAFHVDRLEAELADDGRPFDPLSLPEPATDLPLQNRPEGGLGIHLVRRLMDEFQYRREAGHNRLRLLKRWDPAGERA